VQTTDSTLEALQLGVGRSLGLLKQMYLNLASLLSGRVSTRTMGGPVELASQTFSATEHLYLLLLWLGMLSLNLAVINSLPIPLLDAGDLLVLSYEKVRGKPLSARARWWVIGVALVLLVMLFAWLGSK
jgi:regulator of sigma E protease